MPHTFAPIAANAATLIPAFVKPHASVSLTSRVDEIPVDSHRISRPLLARLVRACAANVDATIQAAIVSVESGGNAWALHDDNDGSTYAPNSYEAAQNLAQSIIERNRLQYGSQDRGVDVGLAQINSLNFAMLGVGASAMLDPCDNLRASQSIILTAYQHERSLMGSDGDNDGALRRALQVYNSGQSTGDDAYVRAIFASVSTPFVHEVGGDRPVARQIPPESIDMAPMGSLSSLRRSAPKSPGVERGAMFAHRDAFANGQTRFRLSRVSDDGGMFVEHHPSDEKRLTESKLGASGSAALKPVAMPVPSTPMPTITALPIVPSPTPTATPDGSDI